MDRAQFIERFALGLTEDGFPRMSARVFAAILISERGRLTAAELGEVLDVSAAAVSGAVRHLATVGLVERERTPGSRRDAYRLRDNVWYESFVRADDRFARWTTDLALAQQLVPQGSPAEQRLDEARRFFQFLRESFPELMAAWKARRDEH